MTSYFYKYILPGVLKNLNVVSLMASCVSLASMIVLSKKIFYYSSNFLGCFRSFIFNRVTIRFQAIITILDLARHVVLLNLKQPEGGLLCDFLGFLGFFLDHLYIFINVIIAVNIQLLYLHGVRPKRRLEFILVCLAILLALLLDVTPFFFDAYGLDKMKNCFLKESAQKATYRIILLYVTLPPGMIYCLIVFVAVMMSLHFRKDYIDSKFPDKRIQIDGEVVNARDFVRKLYFRLSFYPVTSFVCFLFYLVQFFLYDSKVRIPETVRIIGMCGIRSTGIINFIALLSDPHFFITIKSIWPAREEYKYKADLESHAEFETTRDLEKDEPKCYIDFIGKESLSFEEYIRFL